MLAPAEIVPLLQEAAARALPTLHARVAGRLEPRERRLCERVMDRYASTQGGRWYDPYHVLYSTDFGLDLVAAEQADPLLAPAVLLHDLGYTVRPPGGDWRGADSRITHMQEGAALAARLLAEEGYRPAEIETVVELVAVHDNPYLRIPLSGALRLQMRDCDRVWVMHPVSFYKDWANKPPDDPNHDLRFFLAVRRVHFFGLESPAAQSAWGVTAPVRERALDRVEPLFTELAARHVERQFHRRREEIASPELLTSPTAFLRTLEREMALAAPAS